MKDIYVVLAFHAHELLWDLPEKLLSYLDDRNPMKRSILDQNFIKKRKEEDRDIYTLGIQLGEKLNAPICVEFTNELLHQIGEITPEIFQKIKEAFHSGQLYPIYGHAHHTHISLLNNEEITQEIVWNMQFLHNSMHIPYPKYKGLFSPEASYSFDKLKGAVQANIDYLIFPHLNEQNFPFALAGKGDYTYKPFLITAGRRDILALPRNFPISQEIWRPITRMKRDAVKDQGFRLGDYSVFANEYLGGQSEQYPITLDEGIEIYKSVLRRELNQAPPDALLVYIQDLELMDFGDLAIEILIRAWQELLTEDRVNYRVKFVTPDQYIDQILVAEGVEKLPHLKFDRAGWIPEIRLVLRTDGHYPPSGVTGVGCYSIEKSGIYDHPHIFWENGKYFCGIFDQLAENFLIKVNVSTHAERLNEIAYDLGREEADTQVTLYLRLMKRACNWGWQPTEGRQKRPCLYGYLLCAALLKMMEHFPAALLFTLEPANLEPRHIVGLVETLKVFVDNRLAYLRYGMEKYMAEHGGDLSEAYREIEEAVRWKNEAVGKARELYAVNGNENLLYLSKMKQLISLMQDYCRALFMATEYIQKIWNVIPDVEYMVDRMYEYLYEIYPPLFPAMIEAIDAMSGAEVDAYFAALEPAEPPLLHSCLT